MVKPKFFKKILPNGMTIIFEQRKNSKIVSVAFAVKYGGMNESKEDKGISHFIEHMLYKGTKKRTSKEISCEIEKHGGVLNGFTDEELTAYWCKIPSEHTSVALDVLSDMIKNPLFNQEEIDKERKVIFEEIKMRNDSPQHFVFDNVQSLLFNGNLGYNFIGTPETLNKINKDLITKKFKEIYTTNNLILCVVGDTNFDYLCDFCEKNFEKTKAIIHDPEIKIKNEEFIEKRKGIDQANMIFAFHSPNALDKKSYASQVLSVLMAGGASSRLYQEIREKRNLVYGIKGIYNGARLYGYTQIYVGASPENLDTIKRVFLEEFDKIKELTEEELKETKDQIIGNSRISREDSQGQMLDLLFNEIHESAEISYKFEKNISKVKLRDVKELAKIKNYSTLTLIPE